MCVEKTHSTNSTEVDDHLNACPATSDHIQIPLPETTYIVDDPLEQTNNEIVDSLLQTPIDNAVAEVESR